MSFVARFHFVPVATIRSLVPQSESDDGPALALALARTWLYLALVPRGSSFLGDFYVLVERGRGYDKAPPSRA